MLKVLIVLALWICTLGIFSVKVKWADGWYIELIGWPEAIKNYLKSRE